MTASASDTAEAERILGISQDEGFGELLLSDDDNGNVTSVNRKLKGRQNITTSDSEESLGNRPRRKPKKKRKEKPVNGVLTPLSPSKMKKLTNGAEDGEAKTNNRTPPKDLRYYGTNNDGSVSHFQIESFIHRSKSNFNVEDVKAALDNAKIIGDNDKTLDLGGKAKKVQDAQALRVAKKWRVFAEKIQREHGRTGLEVLDKKLAASDSPANQSPRHKPPSPRQRLLSTQQTLLPSLEKRKIKSSNPTQINRASKGPMMMSGPPKPEQAESTKRLELMKAARKVQPKLKKIADKVIADEKAQSQEVEKPRLIVGKASLPLVTRKDKALKAQLKTEAEAERAFYREFRIIYVDIPIPHDEFPRE